LERAGVEPLQEALDDELRAQIKPLDLVDDRGLQVLFGGGHGNAMV